MDRFLYLREMGDRQAARDLQLWYTTHLLYSLEPDSGVKFKPEHPTGINALEIERQDAR
jgi:hypothetical protein